MQKWEYITMKHWLAANLRERIVSIGGAEKTRVANDGFALLPFLNKLGGQGWELIGVDLENDFYVFKRPLD